MRKIIVSMNVTLDGFMAGPNCELDWHFQHWNQEMAETAGRQLSKTDTILLGRITYQAMAQYWPSVEGDLSFPREDIAFAEMMNDHSKIVFSKTLIKTGWKNARLAGKNVRSEISRLKHAGNGQDKDMIIYGSGVLVSRLMRLDLIDEYILWVHPVILGKGKPLFKKIREKQRLRLLTTKTFSSGVVMLCYGADYCGVEK